MLNRVLRSSVVADLPTADCSQITVILYLTTQQSYIVQCLLYEHKGHKISASAYKGLSN